MARLPPHRGSRRSGKGRGAAAPRASFRRHPEATNAPRGLPTPPRARGRSPCPRRHRSWRPRELELRRRGRRARREQRPSAHGREGEGGAEPPGTLGGVEPPCPPLAAAPWRSTSAAPAARRPRACMPPGRPLARRPRARSPAAAARPRAPPVRPAATGKTRRRHPRGPPRVGSSPKNATRRQPSSVDLDFRAEHSGRPGGERRGAGRRGAFLLASVRD